MKHLLTILLVCILTCSAFGAKEIRIGYSSAESDQGLYAVVWDAVNDKVWSVSGAAWDGSQTNAEIDNYDIGMTYHNIGFYTCDFPTGITTAARYNVLIYDQAGGSPDLANDEMVGGGEIIWDGDSEETFETLYDLLDTEVAAILADTDELQLMWAEDAGRVDLILAAILEDTGTTLPAQIRRANAF